jgi:hypothetical protein
MLVTNIAVFSALARLQGFDNFEFKLLAKHFGWVSPNAVDSNVMHRESNLDPLSDPRSLPGGDDHVADVSLEHTPFVRESTRAPILVAPVIDANSLVNSKSDISATRRGLLSQRNLKSHQGYVWRNGILVKEEDAYLADWIADTKRKQVLCLTLFSCCGNSPS